MQVHNVNLPITVTGRHVEVTAAMRDYAQKMLCATTRRCLPTKPIP